MEKEHHLTPLARVQPLAGLFDKNEIHCISGNVSYRNTNTTVQQYMNKIIYCGAVCSGKKIVDVPQRGNG